MKRRGRHGEPDVLDVLRIELKKQRELAERELRIVRARHAEERTPPNGTSIPPNRGGSIPRRDK